MKTSKDKFSITALLLTFVGVLFVGVVIVAGILFFNAKTLMVPSVEFPTISDAVTAAVPGDIILVKAKEDGTPYEENVEIIGEDKKNIKLIGIGKEKPILDGDVVGGTGITITNTSGVLVKNFMIQKFVDPIVGFGIILNNSNSNMIKGNNINENGSDGILLISSPTNMIKGNNVNENGGDGIFLSASPTNMIKGNNVKNNFGIILSESDSNTIKGNTSNDNGNDGISLFSSDNNILKGNTANNNGNDGLFLSSNSNDNDVFFNRTFDNVTFDIEDLNVTPPLNNFKGNKCGTSSGANVDCGN